VLASHSKLGRWCGGAADDRVWPMGQHEHECAMEKMSGNVSTTRPHPQDVSMEKGRGQPARRRTR
jgi:hypothetical protein